MTRLEELSQTFADNPLAELLNPPPLDDTYGALFLGTVFGLMVYGLTVHQVYRYYRLYPNDPLVLKLLAISGLATLLSQGFYAGRVWFVAPQHRWIVGLAVVPAFVFIAATVESVRVPVYEFGRFSWMISVMYGAAGVGETLFTGTLIFVLRRSRTGFKRTNAMIDLLILYAINTGTTVGFLGFIFPLIYPDNLIYVGVSIVETKLYASCVLTALTSRATILKSASGVVDMDSSRAELAKEIDSERGHEQRGAPNAHDVWNF
ncbi:hypothetical protein LXA43DRAFT_1149115 [Ganoderma leucocontextum]|nr:hypothetical protein LXA43DRAFT_1149115 [Ganoderma leucocontextum]